MPTKLKSEETILFIGDSITDCGRREPQHAPLGCGYVHMVSDMLTIREPRKNITVLNRGISGDTVANLRSRWSDDALALKPDWLSLKIGINDLNQTLSGQADLPPEKFEENYDYILAQTVKRLPNCKLLLLEPFFMSRDSLKESYRARVLRTIPGYIDVVRRMSQKYKTRLVKTHDLFQAQLKHHPLSVFSHEPVHPNSAGHLLMAEAVYNALS
jgi:lysophospholipase L1-like esterase